MMISVDSIGSVGRSWERTRSHSQAKVCRRRAPMAGYRERCARQRCIRKRRWSDGRVP
jgi:hypothetical protein